MVFIDFPHGFVNRRSLLYINGTIAEPGNTAASLKKSLPFPL
jgi:hypothetical protein